MTRILVSQAKTAENITILSSDSHGIQLEVRMLYHCASVCCLAGHFVLIGGDKGLPVVAFALKTGRKNKEGDDISYDEFDIMDRMKEYHWQLPAYTLPKNAE